ncbi:Dad2 protein [Maudiozyma humilis]|uniref:DASH complex subunit DAD2 n=1 Tax=Maudiozyma humilis TaxID=51915 RepID=A0AAV5RRH0_MAUHU|nr:Dad2 protein [Kazachstania humilis]
MSLQQKQAELAALTAICTTTEHIKTQLAALSAAVARLEHDASAAADVLSIWDGVARAIAQAGLGLLRYTDADYAAAETSDTAPLPLPEPLVRVPLAASDDEPAPPGDSTASAASPAKKHRPDTHPAGTRGGGAHPAEL